jgi:hypothetical protein
MSLIPPHLKDTMDKEIEINPVKWIKSIWNWIIKISPTTSKREAWPDKNTYKRPNPPPPARPRFESFSSSSSSSSSSSVSSSNNSNSINIERPMTPQERKIFDDVMDGLDGKLNSIFNKFDEKMDLFDGFIDKAIDTIDNTFDNKPKDRKIK